MRNSLITIILLTTALNCVAQAPVFVDTTRNLLLHGIYLENEKVLIPWHSTFSQMSSFGHPKIKTGLLRAKTIVWNQVIIFDSIQISLEYYPAKDFTLYGSIDSSNFFKAKAFIEGYTNTPGKLIQSKRRIAFQWVINNCGVRIGYWNATRKLPARYFLDFQPI